MTAATTIIRVAIASTLLVWTAAASANPAEICNVPNYLLLGDKILERVSVAVRQSNALRIIVFGGMSSSLPGPSGAAFAYPARLEAALSRRLHGIDLKVETHLFPRQPASMVGPAIGRWLPEQKPSLVIWQTGSYDAMRGVEPTEFRAAVEKAVEKLQQDGIDVVLMNMQYSPRTEQIVAIGAYAESLRWVSREREVPVFDRLAIMRNWYETGEFDLYAATKDMKTAKNVHDCLAKALAQSIIDAANLGSFVGTTPK